MAYEVTLIPGDGIGPEIAEATRREVPDVAIVGVDGDGGERHALDLISAIVKQAACPVIADIDADDDSFIEKAARRVGSSPT